MSQLLVSVIAFIVAISILVFVHEFGHFWVARRFGIRVLRFSIGFGRPLFRWYDKLGTEYVLSLLPLGGYVSLFGERGQVVSPSENTMAFSAKPVGVRIAVLLAGPLFNFIFAILAYWLVFLMGIAVYVPILGTISKDSIAGLAGLRRGQEIVALENKPINSWEAFSVQLLAHLGEDNNLTITVKEPNGELETKNLNLSHWDDTSIHNDILESLGLREFDPVPPVVGKAIPGFPGEKAGLLPQDRILKVNNIPVESRSDVIDLIQTQALKKVFLEIQRNGQLITAELVPLEKKMPNGKSIGFMGVEFPMLKTFPKELMRIQHYGPLEALGLAVTRTFEYSVLTLEMLKKMIVGKISVRHVSGPLAIAKYAGQSVSIGFQQFLSFLAMISISLGVLNLLPIPILDGGHIIFCVFEIIRGQRLSDTAQNVGMLLGGIVLIGFMLLAFYNDFSMLFM